jgi:DNA-directed RNA polymerase I, II, and III subunit RPABC2
MEEEYQAGGDVEDIEDVIENLEEVVGGEEGGDEGTQAQAQAQAQANIRPELRKLYTQHPELIVDYVEAVVPLLIGKETHKTYPFLTLYEKTKIIGLRANQLSQGAHPYVVVPEYMTSVRDIARMELEQKRLPFIVKRPLPNGTYEYWRLADLMILV